jgi:putative membrane protein
LKVATYLGGALGIALLLALLLHANLPDMAHAIGSGGWPLLWLAPYRALFYLLYAIGWIALLRPYDPERRAGLGFAFWVTTVRDGIDRLLPVASVGGGVAAVRLMGWRGLGAAAVSVTVILEVLLTVIVSYLFTALGLAMLLDFGAGGPLYDRLLYVFLLSLPIPAVLFWLLRHGSLFSRLRRLMIPLVGEPAFSRGAAALDHMLRTSLQHGRRLAFTGALQLAALASGAFEVWFALRLFGHPISVTAALILESMTQAARHIAFVVPGGIGVQEAGLVLIGQLLGVSSELALAVSMAKRLREVIWGIPALISWQWLEGRRLQKLLRSSAHALDHSVTP